MKLDKRLIIYNTVIAFLECRNIGIYSATTPTTNQQKLRQKHLWKNKKMVCGWLQKSQI